jgi:hypothetical protein
VDKSGLGEVTLSFILDFACCSVRCLFILVMDAIAIVFTSQLPCHFDRF